MTKGLHTSRKVLPPIIGRRVDEDAFRALLAVMMGGFAAELRLTASKLPLFADPTSGSARRLIGAENDIERAFELATAALMTFRNDIARELARGLAAGEKREDVTARLAADQVRQHCDLIDDALRDAHAVVDSHWPAMRAVARALLRRGSLEGDEVRDLIEAAG